MSRMLPWLSMAVMFVCVASRPDGSRDFLSTSPLAHIMTRVLSNDYSATEDMQQLCSYMHAVELTAKLLRDMIEKKAGSVERTCAAFEPFDVLTSRTPKSYMGSRRLLF